MKQENPTASIVIIGNEILSGRTQDTNTHYIASKLTEHGIILSEARVIPDDKDIIIGAVRSLSSKFDYVFTTGGIGPTHDDITAESIAAAFNTTIYLAPNARQMLLNYYGSEADLTEARLKMAYVPMGSELIENPVSGAPGFKMGNVYSMAGVPKIMQAMLDNILAGIKQGPEILSKTVSSSLTEGIVAKDLTLVQSRYDMVDIGSYPYFKVGDFGLNLVLRSTDAEMLDKATQEVIEMITKLGGIAKVLDEQIK